MVDRYSGRNTFRAANCNGTSFGIRNNCNGTCASTRNNSSKSRCNSCADGNSECKKLLKQLQMLDFAMIETVLYLDAYPHCKEALSHYHMLKQERNAVAEALSKGCNMPVTSFENASTTEWNWTDAPWPWEHDAN